MCGVGYGLPSTKFVKLIVRSTGEAADGIADTGDLLVSPSPPKMSKYYSSTALDHQVLALANDDELLQLSRLFKKDVVKPMVPAILRDEICRNGGHGLANWVRGEGVAYTEVLHDVAAALKVDCPSSLATITSEGVSLAEMDVRLLLTQVDHLIASRWRVHVLKDIHAVEKAVLAKFMADAYAQMTPEQKAEVDKKVQELTVGLAGSGIKGLSASAAFLAMANAGGFATYMLMSSVISALSLGTAAFGVYTAASTLLSVFLGPAGWTVLGLTTLYKFGSPNQQRSVQAVLAVAVIRARLHVGPNPSLEAAR